MSIKPGLYTVEVTQEDINLGFCNDCFLCPVARAVCRVFDLDPNEQIVEVGGGITFNKYSACWTTYPPEVTEFIKYFDEDLPVRPFSFVLEVNDL